MLQFCPRRFWKKTTLKQSTLKQSTLNQSTLEKGRAICSTLTNPQGYLINRDDWSVSRSEK